MHLKLSNSIHFIYLNIHFSFPYNSRKLEKPYPKKGTIFLRCVQLVEDQKNKKKNSIEIRTRVFFPSPPQISKNHSTFHIEPVFPSLWNVVEEPFDYLARHVDADLTSVALTSESKEPARALDRSACTRGHLYPLYTSNSYIVHKTRFTTNSVEHGWRAIYRVCIAKR